MGRRFRPGTGRGRAGVRRERWGRRTGVLGDGPALEGDPWCPAGGESDACSRLLCRCDVMGQGQEHVGRRVLGRVRDSRELLIGRVSVVTGFSASVRDGHRWRRRGCQCPGSGSGSSGSSATGGVASSSLSLGCRRQSLTGGGGNRWPVAGGTVDQCGKGSRGQRAR